MLRMIFYLTLCEFRLKYSGSVFGYFWHLILPALGFGAVYWASLQVFARPSSHSAASLLIGLLVWGYFRDATVAALTSVTQRGLLVKDLGIPPLQIIIATGFAPFLSLLLNLAIGIPICYFLFHSRPSLSIVALPLILLVLLILSESICVILALACTRFRDLQFIWIGGLQVFIWTLPVYYSYPSFLSFNPLATLIEGTQGAITGEGITSGAKNLLTLSMTCLLLLSAMSFSKKMSARISEGL